MDNTLFRESEYTFFRYGNIPLNRYWEAIIKKGRGFSAKPTSLFVVCLHHILFVPLYRPIMGRIGGKLKKGTQRGGEHGGESRQYHGGAEGTKSDRAVVYVLLITLVINMGLQDFGVIRFATYV